MLKSIIFFLLLLSSIGYSQKQFEVYFDFAKEYPNEVSIQNINQWMQVNPSIEIIKIEGYCDSVDTKEYNYKLAERRIDVVLKILEAKQLATHPNLEKNPFGKDFKQSNIQAENRKVILYYTEKRVDVETPFLKELQTAKAGQVIKLPNLYFYNNSARIVPKSNESLYELLCAMEENPKLKIEIQGHICCQQVFDLNDVSTARARAIYNFLVRNKISKNRMKFKGYGTSRPVHKIPEKNNQEEEENRRVEILIIEN